MRTAFLIILLTTILLSCNGNGTSSNNRINIGSVRDGFLFSSPKTYAVDENGVKLSLLAPFSNATEAQWSPDNQRLVYETDSINPQIVIIKTNGEDGYLVTNANYPSGHDPAWSPDGQRLAAYFSNAKNQNGIYIVDVSCILQGQGCKPDYHFIVHGRMPTWSPDSKQLAFWVDRQIFVVSIDAPRDVKRITPEDAKCFDPEWSPRSDDIAMRCSAPGLGINIFLVNSDGSNFRNISNSESLDLLPTWSPDGTKIAFASERAEDLGKSIINEGIYSNAVYIMNSDGTDVKRVSPYSNESIDWIDWVGQ